ncbi:MAG: tRNA (cytidine(34)-2'-O)-methyltransferase [Clostridia bacterium]|nr:tRNA (cytidine(34)-2'-O)-methyltransferase [Clostridia bacterium]
MTTRHNINIALIEPEIPQNTGNIARTCAAVGASLHLVGPMGFAIDNSKLKRAGLDYCDKLDIHHYGSLAEFLEKNLGEALYFFTTKAQKNHTTPIYPKRVFLVFGKETAGLPEKLLLENKDTCVRIPMRDTLRSLNLSNSAAIAVYEVLRQREFEDLREDGNLTQYEW